MEREGKGMRLTASGRELARISRFFMMGLSNFQRGCLAEEQEFKIGASATFAGRYLLPVLAGTKAAGARYDSEVVSDGEIERRLHDLTLDFGVIGNSNLSRPLQTAPLRKWNLKLWVPKAMGLNEAMARREFLAQKLPLVLAKSELDPAMLVRVSKYPSRLMCDSFLAAKIVLEGRKVAALLPDFLMEDNEDEYFHVRLPQIWRSTFRFYLAWNPRMLRLNPHSVRQRDFLVGLLRNNEN